MTWRVIEGDALERLRELEDESVQTCVTSPPYFGLRDYGTGRWEGGDDSCDHVRWVASKPDDPGIRSSTLQSNKRTPELSAGTLAHLEQQGKAAQYRSRCGKCGATRTDSQIGLEATPDEYVAALVGVFREVRRVLRDDGTLWLNLGDSYAGGGGGNYGSGLNVKVHQSNPSHLTRLDGYKPKDLLGIPWAVAFALRTDGWYLRSDVIWSKPNPMPESVTDRPTKAHEYLFLLSKKPRYFYDHEAIREPHRWQDPDLLATNAQARQGARLAERRAAGDSTAVRTQPPLDRVKGRGQNGNAESEFSASEAGRNKRSVWTVATAPFPGAHFAVFPPKLIEPCILAGSSEQACGVCGTPWRRVVEHDHIEQRRERPAEADAECRGPDGRYGKRLILTTETVGWEPSCDHHDDTGSCAVLDPFCGAGTTGLVATRHHRSFVGIELNPAYAEMARQRIRDDQPLMNYLSEVAA